MCVCVCVWAFFFFLEETGSDEVLPEGISWMRQAGGLEEKLESDGDVVTTDMIRSGVNNAGMGDAIEGLMTQRLAPCGV